MRRRAKKLTKTPFIIAWLLITCCATFGAVPIVWIVPSSLVRVYTTDAPGSGTTATINCARGEYCAFQVETQAPACGLTNINFCSPCFKVHVVAPFLSTDMIMYCNN